MKLKRHQLAVMQEIDGKAIGRAFQVASGQENQHKVPLGTYGSVAILDLYASLAVMVRDERIRKFLEENDPKALEAAEAALA